MIRAAHEGDVVLLHEIERAAGAAFREVGMDSIADDETPSARVLHNYQRAGQMWVAANAADRVIAYLLADIIDGNAHIEQVSVHPDFGRRGFGRALIETVAAWAVRKELSALTLTTFAHVPWNAPYYERLGFSVIPPADLGPGLREIRGHEAATGLDSWPRVAMRRPVAQNPTGGEAPVMDDDAHLNEVRKLYETLIEAWNRRDARGMAERFAAGGMQIGFDGSVATGPDEIAQHLEPIFRDHPTARFVTIVKDVRRLGDDAVLLTAIAGMVPPGKSDIEPQANAHQTVVAAVTDDEWRIELFQNTPAQFHGRPELVNEMTAELQQQLT